MMMHERLSILGGGGRWLNMFAAMKIAGFTEPEPIYKGIKDGEFKINEKICLPEDCEAENSFIQIETQSFIRWLERRSRLDLDRLWHRLGDISAVQSALEIKIAGIQSGTSRQADRLERHIGSLRSEVAELKQLLIENLRSEKQGRSLGVTRRKRA